MAAHTTELLHLEQVDKAPVLAFENAEVALVAEKVALAGMINYSKCKDDGI